MPRLFVALDLPDFAKDQLHTLRAPELTGARWTTEKQWHVTLHFIGDAGLAAVQSALTNVEAAGFSMALRGVGVFPPQGKARVLWAGIETAQALQNLHRSVGTALRSTGFQTETRPYHPHLTLARFKQHEAPSQYEMQTYLEAHQSFTTERFRIQYFTLYESQRRPQGALYTIRGRYVLNM